MQSTLDRCSEEKKTQKMNYPLKKRRGRPPKYLNVWQNQYVSNLAKEEGGVTGSNNNSNNTSNIGNSNIKTSNGGDTCARNVNDGDIVGLENVVNDNNNNNRIKSEECGDSGTVNHDQAISASDCQVSPNPSGISPASQTPINADVRRIQPNESVPLTDEVHTTCSSPPPSGQSEADIYGDVTVVHSNNNHDVMGKHENCSNDIIDCDASDRLCNRPEKRPIDGSLGYQENIPLVVQEVSQEHNAHDNNPERDTNSGSHPSLGQHVQMAEAVVAIQPLKRRPGRPPGSTKKIRTSYPPFMKPKTQEDQFSLRRFFEAGGRDYNEYLDWLKRNNNSTVAPPRPPTMFPPFYPVPMTGNRMMMTSQSVPGGFPFAPSFSVAVGPRSPVVYHPSSIIPSVTPPVTSQVSVLVCEQGNNNTTQTTFAPSGCQHEQLSPIYIQPGLRPQGQGRDRCADIISESRLSEGGVLDLSSKRMRSDSDSEKENDYMEIPLNKRQRQDNEQYDLTSKLLIQDKHEPGMDTRNCGDAVVESSTEGDVTSWNVDQVADFVARLPECHVYAQIFRTHRIDGATLPHLSDDHLLNHVGMKLGHMIRLQLALSKLKRE